MIYTYFSIIFIILIIIINLIINNNIILPPVMLSFSYLFVILYFIIAKSVTNSLYCFKPSIIYLPIGLFVFSLGFNILSYGIKGKEINTIDNCRMTNFTKIFIIFEFVVLILSNLKLFNDILITNDITNSFRESSTSALNENYFLQLFRTCSFAITYGIVANFIFDKKNKKDNKDVIFVIFQIIISMLFATFRSSRQLLLLVFIPIFFMLLFANYKNNKKLLFYLLCIAPILLLLVLLINIIKGQTNFIPFLQKYLCSGFVAYTEFVSQPFELLHGMYTFRLPLKIINLVTKSNFQTMWVEMKYPVINGLDWSIGNVYSFYHGYTRDFGILYAMLIQFIIGIIHGLFYKRAYKNKDTFSIIVFVLLYFPLITQFFNDHYISLLSLWIQIIFVLFIFTKTNLFYKRSD